MTKHRASEFQRLPLEQIVVDAQSGFASGERASDGVIQLRMNNVTTDGSLDWSNVLRVPATKKQIEGYQLQSGDVLFNSTNSPSLVGKTTIFGGHEEPVVFSNHFVRIRVDDKQVDPRYLARWFNDQWNRRTFEKLCTQWVNQAAVRKEDLLALEVPLPPLPEQQRIAARLDKADRLRRLRRYALDLGETYLQSVFLEMFGDPVRNEKKWPRATVEELADVQTGNTPSRDEPENYGDFIEWIKSDDILDGHLWVSQSREMLSEKGLAKGRSVEPYSLLVTCIAGSLTSIGDMALTDRKVAFNQQINAITPHQDVDPFFLYGLFDIARPIVQYHASAGMKHIITKSKLEELVLFKPPMALQEKFAGVVRQYDRLRAQQRESLRQAEMLFGALLEGCFQPHS